ncbi:MAG: hypothetical protein GQ583_12915 [Methyloprofundus sp.]|nr:hypothetical protein [Methyloprofundus sp.]
MINESENLPTKVELLQQALVVIDKDHKQVCTNTLKVAEHFGKRPADINRRIGNLIKKGKCKIAPTYYLDEQGRKQKYYVLNRKIFSQIVLGFTGDKAEDFRTEYVEQFEKNLEELLEWRNTRHDVIQPTKTANDSIEWLRLELIKEIPESRKPGLIYIHIQNQINRLASGNAGIKRNDMSTEQLKIVEWLEIQVHEEIERLKALDLSAVEIRAQVLELIKETQL